MERQKLGEKTYMGKPFKGSKTKIPKRNSKVVVSQKQNFGEERLFDQFHPTLDDSSSVHGDAQSCNGAEGVGFPSIENRVSINLDFKSKRAIFDLKAKLQTELVLVRDLMKRIEHYSGTKLPVDNGAHFGRLKRVHSVVDSVDGSESRILDLPEGKHRGALTGEVGKGMRTPKTAQIRKNSDVTQSDKKVPLSSQTKKSKGNGKKNREESVFIFGMEDSSSKVFKGCNSLLLKLMTCKGGWVFNKPVDVKRLGLHDYFTIIKHPMDLGTVKSRLTTNWYRTPEEFAEDVRLTFHNAMTYNLEGHEVNTLAKQFLKMFEDKWVEIEANYLCQLSISVDSEADLSTPAPTRPPLTAPSQPPPLTTLSLPSSPTVLLQPPPTDIEIIADRSGADTNAAGPEAKSTSFVASGKARLPKPKAKDPHKRDMTLEEKQKLSANLQNLPSEKLEGVLRIVKKRNPSLCQNDEEIEVDIDTVDAETLWELDRFVIYYKKALSKMKRSAELGQIGLVIESNLYEKKEADSRTEEAKHHEADDKNFFSLSSNEGEQDSGNANVSNGSSSFSSDSGSSSSDSDTDSSSS